MTRFHRRIAAALSAALCVMLLSACGRLPETEPGAEAEQEEAERGPHGGRVLEDDGLAVELAIFEAGVPPEFHAWITAAGAPVY